MQNFTLEKLDGTFKPLRYVLLVALLSLFFGYDAGMLFVNQQFLGDYFLLNDQESDVIMGTALLGLLAGLGLGGWLNSGAGRRICLIAGAAAGTFSILVSVFAPNLSILLCAQFVIGFSFGLYILSSILYACEITLPGTRGFACTLQSLVMIAGAMIAVFTRDFNPLQNNLLLIMVCCVFSAVIIVLCLVKLPESPRFLALNGMSDAALNVLFKLRLNMSTAALELASINECCRSDVRGVEFFMQNQNFRKCFWCLLGIMLLLHASGLVIVPYAMSDLLSPRRQAMFYDRYDYTYGFIKAGITVVFFSAVTVAVMADRIGRRALLCLSSLLMNVALFVLTAVHCSEDFFLTAVLTSLFLLLYIFASGIMFLVLVLLLLPELSPARGREFVVTLVLLSGGVAAMFGLQVYQTMVDMLSFGGMFMLFFCCSVMLTSFVWYIAPNTVNASLEGIESRLLEGREMRYLGQVSSRS